VSGRLFATVSVDVDPVDLHLIGYGFPGLAPDPLVYVTALPRLAEIFERCGVRATFFIVGRDVLAQSAVLRALAERGHELASHSFTHPLAFARLGERGMKEELTTTRAALEEATGAIVQGYRSPNFDMDAGALRVLAECGYVYDASGYPTPLLFPARLLLALKSRNPGAVLRLRPWPFTMRRRPYDLIAGDRRLREFPASVTPWARLPIYHTLRYALSDARFTAALDGFARRGEPLSYILHAVDVLGLAEDRVDPRLKPHPGMERPLAAKLDLLERSVRSITQRFEAVPFRDRLAADPPA
jgi:peptidoglycan/xylan/chitin deacetylase (PgdA/CDA1 family)